MPKLERTPPQKLLDVLERVDKLRPQWNAGRNTAGIPIPDSSNHDLICLARIWCDSHSIGVAITAELCFLWVNGLWRGLHFVDARRFTVEVTAKADDGIAQALVYWACFMDKEDKSVCDCGRCGARRGTKCDVDVAACDYLHEYIYRVATPIFQAENVQQKEYEAKNAAEIRAMQDKVAEIREKFWNT